MNRYLIESTHNQDDCNHVQELVEAYGFITHFDWGCEDNVHIGWCIVEAENEKEALLCVPPLIREKARAIKLTKFTPENLKTYHERKSA